MKYKIKHLFLKVMLSERLSLRSLLIYTINKAYSFLLLIGTLAITTNTLFGNNISVSNLSTTGQNTSAGSNNAANFTLVKFDLSWANSWRTSSGPSNWDAAWVFVKYQVGVSDPTYTNVSLTNATNTISLPNVTNLRVGMPVYKSVGTSTVAANTFITAINTGTNVVTLSANVTTTANNNTIVFKRIWEHATLNTTGSNHTAPAGSTISPSSDGTGAFIYRSSDGAGTLSLTDVNLRWQYGTNGVADNAVIQVQVFAIEMVYVPQGSFAAGSGGSATNEFTLTTINTATATTAPSGSGSLGGAAGGYPTSQTAPNTASWPNGFNAYYCMKYEISQGDYRDFLNTLTYRQQENRTAVVPSSIAGTGALSNTNRNGIDIQTPGEAATHTPALYACNLNANTTYNEADDGEWIACNHLNWMDGCAYIDWAGLRPMTELEYEKACRGDQTPVANEYAWGTAAIAGTAYTLSNAGQSTEAIATNYITAGTPGNAMTIPTNTNITGPLRVGIFADISGTRVRTGATYYGIMEMSGNVWERAVTLGNSTGRTFTGMHGDGGLSSNGHANQSNWPGLSSNEVTGSLGSGWRGGGWGDAVTAARISNRANASMEWGTRRNDLGFRGVRVAP